MSVKPWADSAAELGRNLPYLRRYARALTGRQDSGDRYALATLEAMLDDEKPYPGDQDARVALFRAFHAIWGSSGMPIDTAGETGLTARAQVHLTRLSENTREALLLHTIEEFSIRDIAAIMQVSDAEAQAYLDTAFSEMNRSVAGKVMIIEVEAVIAMDLEIIVSGMGHRVSGTARTATEAHAIFSAEKPDLILSDIQLSDGSNGIEAVQRIGAPERGIPVIFITAFPERLLTGTGPEPAFIIPKPFTEEQVRSSVSQAMFFASTETLA